MNTSKIVAGGLLVLSGLLGACVPDHASAPYPDADGVYFITPIDGATVSSPVTVRFGLRGRGVAPAGVNQPNTGHHHLLIDATTPVAMNVPIPSDEHHVHFGGGQTQTVIQLPPGQHTLQLVLGDHLHVPEGPPWTSEKITITVK